jgi:hypothetical protein
MSSLWVGMGRRGAAVPGKAQLRQLPQPVGTTAGDAAHGRRGVVRPSPQRPEASGESLEGRGSMKDLAANPAPARLRCLTGTGGGQLLEGIQACELVSPLERAIELARADASDRWAARRGYAASSLEPAVARAYDLAGHAGRSGMSGEAAQEITWRRRDPQAQHLVYESIEEAALALQDFLFAHQNRLVTGRVLEGTASTRPLPVWRLHGGTVERRSSRRVDVDLALGETLRVGHGPVPL